MNPCAAARGWNRCRQWGGAGLVFALTAFPGVSAAPPEPAPILYDGGGGWAAVTGMPESASPPAPDWARDQGVWVGRLPGDQNGLEGNGWSLPLAEAVSPPPAPTVLWTTSNPFGACVVRSLSIRFDSQVRTRRWSLVFPEDGQEGRFEPLILPGRRQVSFRMELEDAVTRQRWRLVPARHGREGGMFARKRGNTHLYSGTVEDAELDWTLLVGGEPGSRRILQGRVRSPRDTFRALRWRILLEAAGTGIPVLQPDSPPAVVAVEDGQAVALFADLAEPRRFRAVTNLPGETGMEFDLALTRTTGNFPLSATVSVEVDAWDTAGPAAAEQEALARRTGSDDRLPLPEAVLRDGLAAATVIEPSRTWLDHPGGFRDIADAVQYLMLRMSGLFPDGAWMASAFLCVGQAGNGQPLIELDGNRAAGAVNADPDLETVLEMGRNRGVMALERIRRSRAPAVWIKAAGTMPGLDHHVRALHLCDYPAIWEEGTEAPGVDLRHAEAEWIMAMACLLKEAGVCLLVSDAGPLAPFTTHLADALVCESDDPAEMRRQRALAGSRPVVWAVQDGDAAAGRLAADLGFVRPGKINED